MYCTVATSPPDRLVRGRSTLPMVKDPATEAIARSLDRTVDYHSSEKAQRQHLVQRRQHRRLYSAEQYCTVLLKHPYEVYDYILYRTVSLRPL